MRFVYMIPGRFWHRSKLRITGLEDENLTRGVTWLNKHASHVGKFEVVKNGLTVQLRKGYLWRDPAHWLAYQLMLALETRFGRADFEFERPDGNRYRLNAKDRMRSFWISYETKSRRARLRVDEPLSLYLTEEQW